MKFVINNGAGRRIQCVAWEGNVAKVADIIAINKIFHLDRLSAKRLEQRYNLGNIPFELTISQSTEIADKGWYEVHECDNAEAKEVTWDNIGEMKDQQIKINGSIKSAFHQTPHRSGQLTFRIRAVTDGKQKLEVRITAWSDIEKPLKKGQAVQISGVVKSEGYTYRQVANGASIIPTAGIEMESEQMINIVATPQKRVRIQ